MNTPTDERNKVRNALGVYVEEAPPAPEWGDWDAASVTDAPTRPRLNGPITALVASVVVLTVIGGIAALLAVGRDTPSGGQNATSGDVPGSALVEGVDTWADWYDAVLARAVPNGTDETVLQGSAASKPGFDVSTLGVEQILDPVSQEAVGVPWRLLTDEPQMTELGTLVIGGSVQSVVVGAVPATYASDGPVGRDFSRPPREVVCLATVVPTSPAGTSVSSISCNDSTTPFSYGVEGAHPASDTAETDTMTFVVPPDTSVVAIEAGKTKLWQQPRAGLALFTGTLFGENPEDAEVSWKAYAASGEIIAEGVQPFGTDWGPLAVVSADGAAGDALIAGTIRVSADCVLLNEQGSDVLLVWSSENTIWSADGNVVLFETSGGEFRELRDGDKVTLEGGGSSLGEGLQTPPTEFLVSVDWISEPDPSCVADTRWLVDDVITVTPGN